MIRQTLHLAKVIFAKTSHKFHTGYKIHITIKKQRTSIKYKSLFKTLDAEAY